MKKETMAAAKVVAFSVAAGELLHGLTHGAVSDSMNAIAVLFGAAACMVCAVDSCRIALGTQERPKDERNLVRPKPNCPGPGS